VRCLRCGNDNSEENRFCGMCGAKLLPEAAGVASTPASVGSASAVAASAPAQAAAMRSSTLSSTGTSTSQRPQAATISRPPDPEPEDAPEDGPFITGPSFLGLNAPPPRKRTSLSAEPHADSSSDHLDYLLEDEEEPRRGGAGKFILILLALALAAGFGYLRWKSQGIPLLGLAAKRPPVAAEDSDTPDSSSTAAPAANTPAANTTSAPAAPPTTQSVTTQSPTAPPVATEPTTEPATQPAADSSSGASPAASNAAATPDAANTPASTPPSASEAAGSSDASNSSPDAETAAPRPAVKNPAPPPSRSAPKSKPRAAAEPISKPHAGFARAASAPTNSVDAVTEAQKYLYGRGATQDCERGLRLLKPAAAQANPKAMIEMGALYSAGLCTPHDLPTAYRWFAMALRKDPDNQSVQTDLQKLWREMTQPERQLAIKLSQ
jgi:hypothetical protein